MNIGTLRNKLEAMLITSWPECFDHYVTLDVKLFRARTEVTIFAMATPLEEKGKAYKDRKDKSFMITKGTLSAAEAEFTKKVLELNNKIETEEKVKL